MPLTFLTGVLCQSSADASETKVKVEVGWLRLVVLGLLL